METPREENECAFRAVKEMIERMKREVARAQNIQYPEQIAVAKIYDVVADTLAEACKKIHQGRPDGCACNEDKTAVITYDMFILLHQLKEDALLSEKYADALFEQLLKMNPDLEDVIRKDREKGLV